MRQLVWDMGHASGAIEWPDGVESPHEACEQLHYQEEYHIGIAGQTPTMTVYQHQQAMRDGVHRYLIVIQMRAGYEVIIAKDFQRLMSALETIAPLVSHITRQTDELAAHR